MSASPSRTYSKRGRVLRRSGLKATQQRETILALMQAATRDGLHLSAEDLFRQILAKGRRIGLATIYRVLADFESHGLIEGREFEGHAKVYECVGGPHHDHIVNLDTGEVRDFRDEQIEQRKQQIAAELGIEVVRQSLTFYVRTEADGQGSGKG